MNNICNTVTIIKTGKLFNYITFWPELSKIKSVTGLLQDPVFHTDEVHVYLLFFIKNFRVFKNI